MKLFVFTLLATLALCQCISNEEISAGEYLKNLNSEIIKRKNLEHEAYWNYSSNITAYNERKKNEVAADVAKFMAQISNDIKKMNWQSFQSDDLKRQLRMLSQEGVILPKQDYDKYLQALTSMESNFAKVHVCDYKNKQKCDLSLEPEIEEIFSKSRDPEMLKYYWREFYDKAGTPSRNDFEKYIDFNIRSANFNGDKPAAEKWLDEYEDPTMKEQLKDILQSIKPFYRQIHGYVRYRLRQYYGKDLVSETGPIPMHLLGNLWAEQWHKIADIVLPFPNKPLIDVTDEMVKQGFTPLKIFKMGEDFFTSMGLRKLPKKFWDNSILEKPTDGRDLVCHAAAWELLLKDDVRIKQCTLVTQEHLIFAHHELGHIQYYLQYQHQPFAYRSGANAGFHEAMGDVVSLSVSTPKHFERVGLLKNYVRDEETRINQLFLAALEKIVFLPVGFALDEYRWALFRGEIEKSEWNCAFWKLRETYSGIEPPVVRTEKDFDPPAKYHVSAGIDFLRYFVSFVVQFQLYRSACIKANQYEPNNPELPLDNCDIYGSVAAGKSFAKMLSMGASKPWPDALEAFNGERTMSAKAIVEYFEPLRVWLEAETRKNNITLGWTPSDKCFGEQVP